MSRGGHPLVELTKTRYKEFVRQPEALFWVFVFPLLLALALGFAFSEEREPQKMGVAVVIDDGETVAQSLEQSRYLEVRRVSRDEGLEAVRRGEVAILVEPLAGGSVVFHYDPTRPDARGSRLEVNDALQVAAGRHDPIAVEEKEIRERGSRYIDFLIPGLLGLNLMGTGMWGIGFAIVMARMQKLLKRMVATPMKRSHYLASHIASRLIFLVLEVIVLIAFGWIVFDVEVHGSIALLAVASLLGAMTFSGLGILVASRVRTIEGVNGLMNVVMIPMWIFSGVFFSAQRFPEWLQPFIQILPLTALIDALRGVMAASITPAEFATEMAIVAVWGVISFAIALRIFAWK